MIKYGVTEIRLVQLKVIKKMVITYVSRWMINVVQMLLIGFDWFFLFWNIIEFWASRLVVSIPLSMSQVEKGREREGERS